MARKDTAPEPPKGPQQRSTPQPADGSRQRRILYLIGATSIAALAVVFGALALGGDDDDELTALESAGCTLESFPALPNAPDHSDVPSLTTKPEWNSNPPTSGPHYREWAIWNFYEEEVPLVKSVHNLEHGGVVIHYGPRVSQAEVEMLRTFYNEDPNGLLVAPLRSNGDTITLSAWTAPDAATGTTDRGRGWLARCTSVDEEAFSEFIEERRFKGPERFLPEQLAPGT
ncbi:MAG TPA: DUF3105 domain-containing protein [Gaiellaceae bacterium]|nr:DUF3105 domain-containing protein [Gaiellaceae bacterium]